MLLRRMPHERISVFNFLANYIYHSTIQRLQSGCGRNAGIISTDNDPGDR